MGRYVLISISSGILFGIMDGFFNANPLAQKLYRVYDPIIKKKVNMPIGILIDLIYGFALAGIFLYIKGSLPFLSGWLNGLLYGVVVWFLRVVMNVVGQWMMFNVPASTMVYTLGYGLLEMLALGILYGLTL